MPATVALVATAGPLRGRRFDFAAHDTFLFGRAPDCHVGLPESDTSASRHHFLLEVNPPAARLRDLGSLNGTHVNGIRHGGRESGESPEEAAGRQYPEVDLRDGDQIRVGATVLRIAVDAPGLCCECGAEVPAEARAACAWMAGTLLCSDCRRHSHRATSVGAGAAIQTSPGAGSLAPTERPPSSRAGQRVGDYRLLELIGTGGWGAVYRARRHSDGAVVALKLLLPRAEVDPQLREGFVREIEVTRSLRHPNIVALLDHGQHDREFYFVMEYCAGGSVDVAGRKVGTPLPISEAVGVALQALEGLSFAHQRGFVHRDVKPDNLLRSADGTIKVADFGLAKSFGQAGLSGMTATGAVGGTVSFMPREQLTSFRDSRPASDVWSMAATLYFLMTRQLVRDFSNHRDPLVVILRGGVIPIRARDPRVPEALAKVVDQALSDEIAKRPADAGAFKDALRSALGVP
jgi:hypothetical protein